MNRVTSLIRRTQASVAFVLLKAITSVRPAGTLAAADNRGWFRILESYAGAWQQNVEVSLDNVTTHPTVFACVTLIASDIAKMRMRLVQQDADGIWNEVDVPAFSPVLAKPNHYQHRIQFFETWMYSKLLWGNTYVLKVRDNRSVVQALYVLDPQRVTPLVAPNGDVYYSLKKDDLSGLPASDGYVVPASEIIHDRFNCFFHPLVGLSPIYAAGLAAVNGLNIATASTNFFGNGGRPGGALTAPGHIDQTTADRIKAHFDANFSGENAGKVVVLGDGLKYEQMTMTSADAQLIEQLKWSAEVIATVFHVPWHKVGGPQPNYNNIEALNVDYYTQGLQTHAESIELCLDHGIGLLSGDVAAKHYGTEFDVDDLFRMDSNSMVSMLDKGKNYFKPNEGRKRLNLPPVTGGDVVLRQQQDFSLEALHKRDAKADPFAKESTAPSSPPAADEDDTPNAETERAFVALLRKELEMDTAA